jgi:hypothetical protein
MLTQTIWWGGILLEFLLLLRGIQARWASRFPVFYSYHIFIFVQSLVLIPLYRLAYSQYVTAYWICEFVGVLLGSLILLEVYRVALSQYPGTARMVRNLLGFVFAMAVAKALVGHSYGAVWWPAKTYGDLDRNLRVVQAFAILAIVVVMVAYAIPRGRHLKGILSGYSLFVAFSVVHLTLLAYLGDSFLHFFTYVQPFSYDIALCIWVVALWVPEKEVNLALGVLGVAHGDHSVLVTQAKEDLEKIRLGMRGAARR